MPIKNFLQKRKYELLLIALIQHLYIGIFINDMAFYEEILWPVNMVFLGLASIGVFIDKGKWKNIIKNLLAVVVIGFPVLLPFFKHEPVFMFLLNVSYVIFFAFIFIEVFRFLVKPGYINTDIISAAACGMFLLIEIFVFYLQIWAYADHNSFKGINYARPAYTFADLVYYCTITFTTIGYGDITPQCAPNQTGGIAHGHHRPILFGGTGGNYYQQIFIKNKNTLKHACW